MSYVGMVPLRSQPRTVEIMDPKKPERLTIHRRCQAIRRARRKTASFAQGLVATKPTLADMGSQTCKGTYVIITIKKLLDLVASFAESTTHGATTRVHTK